jgi:hypothetical protein
MTSFSWVSFEFVASPHPLRVRLVGGTTQITHSHLSWRQKSSMIVCMRVGVSGRGERTHTIWPENGQSSRITQTSCSIFFSQMTCQKIYIHWICRHFLLREIGVFKISLNFVHKHVLELWCPIDRQTDTVMRWKSKMELTLNNFFQCDGKNKYRLATENERWLKANTHTHTQVKPGDNANCINYRKQK